MQNIADFIVCHHVCPLRKRDHGAWACVGVCIGACVGACIGVRIKCSPFLSKWFKVCFAHAHIIQTCFVTNVQTINPISSQILHNDPNTNQTTQTSTQLETNNLTIMQCNTCPFDYKLYCTSLHVKTYKYIQTYTRKRTHLYIFNRRGCAVTYTKHNPPINNLTHTYAMNGIGRTAYIHV